VFAAMAMHATTTTVVRMCTGMSWWIGKAIHYGTSIVVVAVVVVIGTTTTKGVQLKTIR